MAEPKPMNRLTVDPPAGYSDLPQRRRHEYIMGLVMCALPGKGALDGTNNDPGDPSFVRAFLSVLSVEPDTANRRLAVYALSRLPDEAVTEPLLEALGSTDTATKVHAIKGLARLRARAAVPKLIELLADRSVRFQAAQALVTIRDERALEPLRSACEASVLRARTRFRRLVRELETGLGYV
jgi:HEAT repeat protein